jgi:hypothetical protein
VQRRALAWRTPGSTGLPRFPRWVRFFVFANERPMRPESARTVDFDGARKKSFWNFAGICAPYPHGPRLKISRLLTTPRGQWAFLIHLLDFAQRPPHRSTQPADPEITVPPFTYTLHLGFRLDRVRSRFTWPPGFFGRAHECRLRPTQGCVRRASAGRAADLTYVERCSRLSHS